MWQKLVFAAQIVIFAAIEQKNSWFGGQQRVAIERLDLVISPVRLVQNASAFHQMVVRNGQCLLMGLPAGHFVCWPVSFVFQLLCYAVERILYKLHIFQEQLVLDDGEVSCRVDVALYVGDLVVSEPANHLEDAVHGSYIGQKSISESFIVRGALDKARNVVDPQHRGDTLLGKVEFCKPVQFGRMHGYDSFLGFYGRERVICRVSQLAPGDGLEKGGFSHVGKPNDATG
ncbi:hypothetical protein OGATHE_003529 [Ogataea polymorpha]|uniref:Secreted protein n=1 Tax=Ogataea polymorpha TaxID=460523 RepID=A0A9P8T3Z7_9ASCO|nr:hypothetical protein OGATHE_003529 [Ogataea polymorpha]